MAAWRSTMPRKRPRRSLRLVRAAKKASTALSQDALVGVKWKVTRGWRALRGLVRPGARDAARPDLGLLAFGVALRCVDYRGPEARPEGPGRALDGEVVEGQALRRRLASGRPRGPGLRVQESRRHRPGPRAHPHLGGARHDGAQLANLVTRANTGSGGVWSDTAYRSKANEQHLASSLISIARSHPGGPCPRTSPAQMARLQ